MSDYADRKPRLNIPNPFGFMPLYEQINHIYPMPAPNYSDAKPKGVHRRTAPIGRDWLGVGFQKGDIILGSVGTRILEVDELFLDDSHGNPYSSRTNLMLEKSSGRVFGRIYSWDHSYQKRSTLLQAVDMSWIGTHLGLLGSPADPQYGDNFIDLSFQTFRVRAKALATGQGNSGSKRSLMQHQITVLGQDAGRELLAMRLESQDPPLIGDPIPFVAKS